jgi:hypothetical protein
VLGTGFTLAPLPAREFVLLCRFPRKHHKAVTRTKHSIALWEWWGSLPECPKTLEADRFELWPNIRTKRGSNIGDEEGSPCSRSSVGASFGPASL